MGLFSVLKLKRIPLYILIAINVGIILGLLLTGYADRLNPVSWPTLCLGGYAFPFFLAAAVVMMVVWAFVKKRYMLISVIGLLMAYQPVTLFCPVNPSGIGEPSNEVGEEGRMPLKVLSFNTCNWGMDYTSNDEEEKRAAITEVMDYLAGEDADIICLQESTLTAQTDSMIKNRFGKCYQDTIYGLSSGSVAATIISRYPVVRKERIPIPSVGNGAGAFWVALPDNSGSRKQRTVCVVNCHLETVAMSVAEKEQFSTIVHSLARGDAEHDTIRSESRFIINKLSLATQKRAPQADMIAEFIERQISQGYSVLVCGDFNDIPQSYTHRRIQGNLLKDCYREAGFGPGFSINRNAMKVRIDNILCTPDIEPLSCHVDHAISLSDHYPIKTTVLW